MQNVRVRFRKEGRAKYISHLDLNRCMARAIKRSGVPVWYTQGFNPHPYITFGLPLPIFYESVCENMDFRLNEELSFEEIQHRLSQELPEGIVLLRAAEPVMKVAAIAQARYSARLEFDNRSAEELTAAFHTLRSLDSLPVEKTTKRGVHIVDVKPYLDAARCEIRDGLILLDALLPASSTENLNPASLVLALANHAQLIPDFEQFTRMEIYDAQLRPFE